ncbi:MULTISPECIES: sugar kinase [unclassified Uliginosibacterium]|jgi:NAD kinase|uniref:sugar kinase n=1 Tax=unclassified Uliginosibacterium TaxID=2621521 RepID=UPI000C7C7CFA|nr:MULTISPECIES: sugar kinase [unclassified Uliginosibacterium]MDO6388193.1 hypothetical protein [Uliginosibacterium sp. 31-12]PLK50650.1 sugar kinase [Uliginosibacterium sp. TH139]
MERSSENKIVLVTRRTRLEELIQRFNTEGQARFYVEHLGADFSDYQLEHRHYREAVTATSQALARHGRLQVLDRAFVPNFVFGPHDTVVALGQDGLVANVLKYLEGQPLIGVNPDPARWEGVLLPFVVRDLDRLLPEVFAARRPLHEVSMAQASLNTGETLCAVNDLFIGPRTHTSARYEISCGGVTERQSSSGIIVSTGMGGSGWLRSVLAGASGIATALGGDANAGVLEDFRWESDYLYFSVREPWPSKTSASSISFGQVSREAPLILVSQMAENGVIFSDGIESDYLQFNAGTRATISLAERRGILVG